MRAARLPSFIRQPVRQLTHVYSPLAQSFDTYEMRQAYAQLIRAITKEERDDFR